MNLPNILTLSRIVLIPVFVIAYYLPFEWSNKACAVLFAIAAITDWLDGYLARRWNQATPFGAFLDPVADKLMVAIALAVIIEHYQTPWITVPSMIIIGREIVVSALREWMAERGKRDNVKVSFLGKLKTACQMWAILFLLLGATAGWVYWGGVLLVYLAAGMTLWSMYLYLTASWEYLFASEEQKQS